MSVIAIIFLIIAVILLIVCLFVTFSCMMISGEISHEEEEKNIINYL